VIDELQEMVSTQIAGRGVRDPRILSAMRAVPRQRFVPAEFRDQAYDDTPLPIGYNQTISQPLMVAVMTELAAPAPGDRALEVGAGSGYQAAILAQLCDQVYAIEIEQALAEQARRNLADVGVVNVTVACRDGGYGWPEVAPFDVIVVSAAVAEPPAPLLEQLADGGRLVAPVGPQSQQELVRIVRRGAHLETSKHGPVRFVSFTGDYA
jgi:protein-L-isoaspartate(D-aspartate) O-methyltransferase